MVRRRDSERRRLRVRLGTAPRRCPTQESRHWGLCRLPAEIKWDAGQDSGGCQAAGAGGVGVGARISSSQGGARSSRPPLPDQRMPRWTWTSPASPRASRELHSTLLGGDSRARQPPPELLGALQPPLPPSPSHLAPFLLFPRSPGSRRGLSRAQGSPTHLLLMPVVTPRRCPGSVPQGG